MERPNTDETDLKVFNTAKVFAEKILFPIMFDYKKYKRQANFGSDDLNNALELPEEIRDIQRFNGLKGMAVACYDLLDAISSTVETKNNKEEMVKLKEFKAICERVEDIFDNHKGLFFHKDYRDMGTVEVLNKEYFRKIRKVIDVIYINTEILMTRNKLLFADSKDEFKSDAELIEEIKKEYTEF